MEQSARRTLFLGQICEVSDGEAEQLQQGCIAQAWSVAEVLRIGVLTR